MNVGWLRGNPIAEQQQQQHSCGQSPRHASLDRHTVNHHWTRHASLANSRYFSHFTWSSKSLQVNHARFTLSHLEIRYAYLPFSINTCIYKTVFCKHFLHFSKLQVGFKLCAYFELSKYSILKLFMYFISLLGLGLIILEREKLFHEEFVYILLGLY